MSDTFLRIAASMIALGVIGVIWAVSTLSVLQFFQAGKHTWSLWCADCDRITEFEERHNQLYCLKCRGRMT